MKKQVILTSTIFAMTTTMVLFSGCNNKPTERPAVVNAKSSANIMAIKDLGDITNDSAKTVYYSGSEKTVDPSLKQAKLEGTVQSLISRISNPANKAAIDNHLKTGTIAIVVLDDQIKILKVVPETSSTFETTLTSLAYLSKLKALVKTSNAQSQAALVSELESIRYKSPAQLGENFGLVEVTSIKVDKFGVLDNERTDYNEKKSILNVIDRPFEVSTHLIIGSEVGGDSADASEKTAITSAQ